MGTRRFRIFVGQILLNPRPWPVPAESWEHETWGYLVRADSHAGCVFGEMIRGKVLFPGTRGIQVGMPATPKSIWQSLPTEVSESRLSGIPVGHPGRVLAFCPWSGSVGEAEFGRPGSGCQHHRRNWETCGWRILGSFARLRNCVAGCSCCERRCHGGGIGRAIASPNIGAFTGRAAELRVAPITRRCACCANGGPGSSGIDTAFAHC